jgi:2-octaprenyl-6-methoxyphenol hydroxylase
VYHHQGREHHLEARLAVVADGGKLLETSHPPKISEYGQSAVIAHITCAMPQADTAFERFTAQGPVALLPYKEGYEIVWTGSHEKAKEMLQWDDATFLTALHQHFGDAVGEFLTVGKRNSFPLRLKRAPDTTLPHTVLIGNAAQTLHPVAGQGFNMGLRDAWELARIILRAQPAELGSPKILSTYRSARWVDRNTGIRFTDGLVRLFSNDLLPLKSGRGWAISALDRLSFAKKFVAKRMMFGANG